VYRLSAVLLRLFLVYTRLFKKMIIGGSSEGAFEIFDLVITLK
jgi:hypothetical protein